MGFYWDYPDTCHCAILLFIAWAFSFLRKACSSVLYIKLAGLNTQVKSSNMCLEMDEVLAGRGGDLVCWDKMVEAINAVCQLTVIDRSGTTGIVER